MVEADLTLTVDGEPVEVHPEGTALVATFRSVRRALHVVRTVPFAEGPDRRAALQSVAGTVFVAGVDILVRLGRRTVARAGPAARPGWFSRLLRLGEVEVYVRQLALAALGR